MKRVHFEIDQTSEDVDSNGVDAAIKIAQTKIKALGLEQFEKASFGFTIGDTTVAFSSYTLPEVEGDDGPEA